MSTDDDASLDPDQAESPSACPRALEALALFVRGGIGVEDERWLRSHLIACPACRDAYRASVRSAAALGHAHRQHRIAETRLRRREAMRSRALAVGEGRKRGRFFGLRMVALLTGVVVLLTWLNPSWNRPEMAVVWESGQVQAGPEMLLDTRPEGVLATGDWCITEAASSARIDTGGGEIWIGHRTQLLVESPRAGRVRLQRGTLEAEGPAVVTSQFGVARIEKGRARIDLTHGQLEIECRSGSLEWVHPGGSQTLVAGQIARARDPGALLSAR